MSSRLPWYAFLYRLLGAQGTFWLWIVAIAALWWTSQSAFVRAVNLYPLDVAVAEVPEDAWTARRWVRLHGLELTLDERLLPDDARARPEVGANGPRLETPPLVVLVDRKDPAAEWWSETLRQAEVLAGEARPAPADPETPAALEARFAARLALLEPGADRSEVLPREVVLVQDERVRGILRAPARDRGGLGLSEGFRRDLHRRVELVRASVVPDVELEGLLEESPPVVRELVYDQLKVVVSPYLMRVGRTPRDWESYVFGVAAVVLVLLTGGLLGGGAAAAKASESEEP